MNAIVDGKTVKVGDWVGFKSDIEQSGQITAIKRGPYGLVLVLQNDNGFQGEYLRRRTTTELPAADCWTR